ncbi:MAG: lysophospholipid acyltransferase family protein [Candidatus Celaenobacter polaris]|nr:lysophospholipid acyltransferase family protein [Candidatus Celaenobacter polaris]
MFNYYIETLLFRILFKIINLFSLPAARRIGRTLGLLNFHIVKVRCAVVKRQLKVAFPSKSEKEITKLIRAINISFGYVAVEFCWFSPKRLESFDQFIQFKGLEHLNEALSHNKGCIIFTGHFGNWELAAQLLGNLTKKVYAVAKKQKNPFFDDFVNNLRESNFVHLIPMKIALRGIVTAIKENKVILMLGDQNAGKSGVVAQFFNMPASTNPGTAKISLKYHVPVLFAVCYRLHNGIYVFHFDKPIYPEVTTSFDEGVREYTQLLTSKLESWVKKYPEQWFWFHRRWKV